MTKFNTKDFGLTDFDALLAGAKAAHLKMEVEIKASERPDELRAAKEGWFGWCKKNLTDRGIGMLIDPNTGEPRTLFVVVAGKRF